MAGQVSETISIYIDQRSAERSLTSLQQTAQKLRDEIARGEAAGRDMTNQIQRLGQTTGAIDTLTRQIDGRMAPSLRQVEQLVTTLHRELRNMSADAPGYAQKFQAFQQASARLEQMRNEIRGINQEMKGGNSSGFLTSVLQGLGIGAGLKITDMISSIVGGLKNLAVDSFKAAANMEQLDVSFTTLLGSQDKANKLIKDLEAFAAATPFEFKQLTQLSKQLLAFGLDSKEIIPTLQMIGDVAAGVGMDKLPNLVYAFGQIRSTGRLMGQDLNQLVNAGFNPLQIISEKTGKSVSSLKSDMEKGLITFKDVEGAFKTATSEGGRFFNLMSNQSKTATGAISNLGDAWDRFKTKFGAGFLNIVGSAARELANMLADLIPDTAVEKFDKLNDSVAKLQRNIIPMADRYDELKNKTKLNAQEQKELNNIIAQLAETVPGAITQFDNYGKALAINTNSVRLFISAERDRLKVVNRQAIDETQAALDKTIQDRKKLLPLLKEIQETASKGGIGTYTMTFNSVDENGNSREIRREATQQEVADVIAKNQELLSQQRGYLAEVERLNGDALQKRINELDEEAKSTGKAQATELTDAQKARIKTAEEGAAALAQKLLDLKDELTTALKTKDQAELERIHNQYDKYLKEAQGYNRTLGRTVITEAQVRDSEAAAIDAKMNEQNTARIKKAYQEQLLQTQEFWNTEKEEATKDFLDKTDTREEYEHRILSIAQDEGEERLEIARRFAPLLTEAAKDEQAGISQNLQKQVQERLRILADAKKKEQDILSDNIAGIQADIISNPEGSAAQWAAREQLIREQAAAEVETWKQAGRERYGNDEFFAGQIRKVNADLNRDLKGLDQQRIQQVIALIQEALSSLSNVTNSMFALQQAQLQSELDAEQSSFDRRKNALDKQLNAGVLSQVNYNKQLEELTLQQAKKEYEIKVKQFNAEKSAALTSVGISAAEGIANIWSKWAYLPPVAVALTAVEGLAIAAQVAAIQAKKPPTPTYAKGRRPQGKGGVPVGPSHADDGIKLINSQTGEVVGEMEGDEPILSKKTYENNRELVDALLDSSMYGGGAAISPSSVTAPAYKTNDTQLMPWAYSVPIPINTTRVNEAVQYSRQYATGRAPGYSSSSTTSSNNSSQSVSVNYPDDYLQIMKQLANVLEKGVKADVYWNEIDKKNKQMAAIQKANRLG